MNLTIIVAASAAVLALVGAQDVVAGTAFYHTWQYAALLTALSIVVVNAGWAHRREPRSLVLAGVLVIALAGLTSGLLGPDTVHISRAPGTVAPIPDLGVAAFFGSANADDIARGDVPVTLRDRAHASPIVLAGSSRRIVGPSIVYLAPQIAAYVEARSASGDRLTVTQPSNPTFLSPVLLFRTSQSIAGRTLPFDTFALPGAHRVVRALYFSAAETQTMQHVARGDAGKAAILFAVNDEAGKPRGIAIAASGRDVRVGGVHLRGVLGSYPALVVASAPYPAALVLGIALVVAGVAWNAIRSTRIHPWTSSSRRLPSESE